MKRGGWPAGPRRHLSVVVPLLVLAQTTLAVPAGASGARPAGEAPGPAPRNIPELPPVDRRLVPAPGGEYGDFDPDPVVLPPLSESPANLGPAAANLPEGTLYPYNELAGPELEGTMHVVGPPGLVAPEVPAAEADLPPPVLPQSEIPVDVALLMNVNNPPAAAQLESPANGAAVDTESPTLQIQKPVTDPDGDKVFMNYQVAPPADSNFTAPVVQSGWGERDYTWFVPSGKLRDGQSYIWRVQTADLICDPDCELRSIPVNSSSRQFTVVLNKWGSDPRWAMWKTELGNGIGLQVNQANGNLYLDYPLDSLATPGGPLDLRLQYNSQQTSDFDFGDGWSISAGPGADPGPLPVKLTEPAYGGVMLWFSDASRRYYPKLVGNQFGQVGGGAGLVTRSDGAPRWRYRTPTGGDFAFDADGKLVSAAAATGGFSSPGFSYTYADGRLTEITDPLGRKVTIAWQSAYPSQITAWDGRTWNLSAADGAGRLASVSDPAGSTVGFGYGAQGNVELVTDGEGHQTSVGYPTTSPRGQPMVGTVRLAGDTVPTSFVYLGPYTGEITEKTHVTDPRGVATAEADDYMVKTSFNVAGLPIRIEGPKEPDPADPEAILWPFTTQLWDTNLNLVCRRTPEANAIMPRCISIGEPFPDGRQTEYTYQAKEPHLLLSETRPTPDQPSGSSQRLTTTYKYDEGFDELYVEYFSNQNLAGRPADAGFQQGVDMNFGDGSPSPAVPADNWSMRLTGILEVPVEDRYYFRVTAANNDGVRLYVGTKEVFDCWADAQGPACPDDDYKLTPGDKRFTLEYRDTGGPASVKILWARNPANLQVISATETKPEVNLLTSVTDPAGTTTFAYGPGDKPRRLMTSETREGRTTSFGYDEFGRVIRETDPLGASSTYTYTGACLTEEFDRTGARTQHTCNQAGDVTETRRHVRAVGLQELPQERVTQTTYDPLGRVDTVTEFIGFPFPRADRIVDNDYNGAGRLVRTTDALDGVTDYVYSPKGLLTMETLPDPDGAGPKVRPVVDHSYDEVGNEISTTDARGQVWTRTFDAQNRITAERDPFCHLNGNAHPTCSTTTTAYDTLARTTTVTDPAGVKTVTSFDLLGRVVSRKPGTLNADTYRYNNSGQLDRKFEKPGPAINYFYNSFGQVTREDRPHEISPGTVVTVSTAFDYDTGGRLERVTDPKGNITTHGYDPEGRVTSVTLPIAPPNKTIYVYNDAGEMVRVTDPEGRRRDFTFDERGRQVEASDARGTTRYRYDPASRLTQVELPTGVTQVFEYDALGRKTRRYGTLAPLPLPLPLPPGEIADEETYDYGPAGHLTEAKTAAGRIVTLTYDAAGRPEGVTAGGQLTTYTYQQNRLRTRADAVGTSTFTYDANGLLSSIADPFAGNTAYTYDTFGRKLTRGGSATTTWDYDEAARVDTQVTANPGPDIVIDLAYDRASNVTAKTLGGISPSSESGTWTYDYDEANRLTSAQDPQGVTTAYGYDGAGNRTKVKVGNAPEVTTTYDEAGHPDSADDGTDYTTDATGALTRVTRGATPTDPGEVTSYAYDTWGRLDKVTDPEALVTTYGYDALDRTVSRTDPLGETAFSFAGDSHDVVLEQTTLAGTGEVATKKVALSPEGPLFIRATDPLGTNTRQVVADPHGDVVALLGAAGGGVKGTRSYSPWGDVRTETGEAALSPFGFQGDWTDPGTGQVDMGARMYEPDLGRFTTMDPLFGQTTNPLTLNRFAYGLDNPTTFNDPTGLCVTEQCASNSAPYCEKCYKDMTETRASSSGEPRSPGAAAAPPSSPTMTASREGTQPRSLANTARRESGRTCEDALSCGISPLLGGSRLPMPGGDTTIYGPKVFCGRRGCIVYQTNPTSHRVQWGIVPTNPFGVWYGVEVLVNGARLHYIPVYPKPVPHGNIRPHLAPPGSVVTIRAQRTESCGFLGLAVCYSRSVPNAYIVPA